MNRRQALQSLGGSAALGLTGAAIVASTSCAPTEAPASERSIASMFNEWLAIHDRDDRGETEEESGAIHEQYVKLQDAIIRAEPKTPRDLAMMVYADNGGGLSDFSDEFEDRLTAMAISGGAMGLAAAAVVAATVPAEAPAAIHDPLLDLINDLKAEEAVVYAMENDDESDAAAEARLSPIIHRIIHETPPATTAAGAFAALERVHYGMSEAGRGVYDKALLKAAMAYLEGRAA